MIVWVHFTRGDPTGDPYPLAESADFEQQLRETWPGPGAFSVNEARLDGPRAGEVYAKAWLDEVEASPWVYALEREGRERALELGMPACVLAVHDKAEQRLLGLPLTRSLDWSELDED